MEKHQTFTSELNHTSNQLPNCYFNPSCENSLDQSDLFESALSSLPGADNSIVLKELIGRLGSICNSSDLIISPQSTTNNSCYNTPLNSPPKLNLSITDNNNNNNIIHENYSNGGTHQFPIDTGFVERAAARFSSFGGSQFIKNQQENNNNINNNNNNEEPPTVSGTGIKRQRFGRKRKGKETQSSTTVAKDDKAVAEVQKDDSVAKRSKSNEKSTEPPKDYIHLRAKRGQATDSHSLAERVRREKISERMKCLQDLVPGCNKVTGKAVMLDEIINYVQSLQRQVEFLSMKLATVNPRMDVSMEALLSKDVMFSNQAIVNHFDASVPTIPYGYQSQINGMIPHGTENQFSMNPLMVAMHRNLIMKPSHVDGFGEASTFWESDLQSVVKMATGRDQPQGFHGQMKVEL